MIKKTDVTRKEFDAEKEMLAKQKDMLEKHIEDSNIRSARLDKHIVDSRVRSESQSERLDKIDKLIEDSRVRYANQIIRDEKQQRGIDELLDNLQGWKWFWSSLKNISVYIGSITAIIYSFMHFKNWFNK